MLDVIDLEKGLPRVYEAMDTLEVELVLAKERRAECSLVIHGYGKRMQGGGKIKEAARKRLKELEAQGKLKKVIFGEDLSMFDETVMRMKYSHSELGEYVGKKNLGVTLVIY